MDEMNIMLDQNDFDSNDLKFINDNVGEYDAILLLPTGILTEYDLKNFEKKRSLAAYILHDKAGRFRDGTVVTTSTVQTITKIKENLYVVQTLNTTYALLIKDV
ncbi:hypothetical protein [Providencia phage PSTCR6]|nr:hypothetical protein [Providencia phage PSTCR6]